MGRTPRPHALGTRVAPTLAYPATLGTRVAPTLAGQIVRAVGGRFSAALGIDPARGVADVEKWFVACALYGDPITSSVAPRAVAALESAGIRGVVDLESFDTGRLVGLLDASGYAREDARTATRLQTLAAVVRARYGEVAEIGRRFPDPLELEAALDALPGWGPATIGLFSRELRGIWRGARPALDPRAVAAGRHLGLLADGEDLGRLAFVAQLARCDERDLEGALVRISLAHRGREGCPGGRECAVLRRAAPPPGTVRHVQLPGGRSLSIRPMRSDDAPGIVALYAGLAEEDVYRRFFASRPPPERFVATMASVATRGGVGLVATVPRRGNEDDVARGSAGRTSRERIVAEATCEPLTDGDGELGITVAAGIRGWLGPFLLDALLEDAAASWLANLQADVLLANVPMLATLRRRGMAVMHSEPQPAVLRVVVGTVGDMPSWPVGGGENRVVVEVQGARWYAEDDVRNAGYRVMGCAGPPGGWASCPPMRGEPCPLAADATVIVHASPEGIRSPLLEAHRRVHPGVPVCAVLEADAGGRPDGGRPDGGRPDGVEVVERGLPGAAMADIVQRMASAS